MKKAGSIGLATVVLTATVSLVVAGSLERGRDAAPALANIYAQLYVRGPRIIHIPEHEPESSDLAPPPHLTPKPERRGDVQPAHPRALFDGPTPIRALPRFKVKAEDNQVRKTKAPRMSGALPYFALKLRCYAATLVSTTCGLALPLPIGIWRGFFASGISRTRSTCSNPFSRLALLTMTWSASWKTRSKARAAMP